MSHLPGSKKLRDTGLAGQHPIHLETQLKEFGSHAQTNDNTIIHSIASKLTELERHGVWQPTSAACNN